MSKEEEKTEDDSKPPLPAPLWIYAAEKAGMGAVDKEQIAKKIEELSKGSSYYENEQKRAIQIEEKIRPIIDKLSKMERTDPGMIQREQMKWDKRIQEWHESRDVKRTWLHIDMDQFYAAVSMRDNPDLIGKPIAVGSTSMISTANYEARKYGVRSAMPGFIGKSLCPSLIFVPHTFEAYKLASNQVRSIVEEYDPHFTSMSLDEVYLDITDYLNRNNDHKKKQSAESVALEIRRRIQETTKLTASAGIGCNRMLAKIASDLRKPNGQYSVSFDSELIRDFMNNLSVRKIPGVGRVCERILNSLGCHTCEETLNNAAKVALCFREQTTEWLLQRALGIAMNERDLDKIDLRKSISQERTFKATNDDTLMKAMLHDLCQSLSKEMKEHKPNEIKGKTLTLKLKTDRFEVRTRAKALFTFTNDPSLMEHEARKLLAKELPVKVRLLGIRMSQLECTTPDTRSQMQLDSYLVSNSVDSNGRKSNSNNNTLDLIADVLESSSSFGNSNTSSSVSTRVKSTPTIDGMFAKSRKRKLSEISITMEEDERKRDEHRHCDDKSDNLDHSEDKSDDEDSDDLTVINSNHHQNSTNQDSTDHLHNPSVKKRRNKTSNYISKSLGKIECPVCSNRFLTEEDLNMHLDFCLL